MSSASPSVLITGATGFIGSHLARRVHAQGWPVRLLVRSPDRLAADLRHLPCMVGDLLSPTTLAAAVQGVDVVLHCAGNVATWDTPEAYDAANVQGVRHLLEALHRHAPAARLVHFSTVDVYGFPVLPATEDRPLSAVPFGYGESKRQGEALVRQWCTDHGQPFCILRPANVFGPGSPFIRRMGAELRNGLMLTVDGGVANSGWLDVDNLADYVLWAARSPIALGRSYNVRDPWDIPWKQVLADLKTSLHGRGIIVNLPFPVANTLAVLLESVHRLILPRHEPLLHRLVVRILGRTCGHPGTRLQTDSGLSGHLSYQESLTRSVAWFQTHTSQGTSR
jgi:nucleoside-diphosphate-sugar epimerase